MLFACIVLLVFIKILHFLTKTSTKSKSTIQKTEINRYAQQPNNYNPQPISIDNNSTLVLNYADGQYRVFHNHYIGGIQYSFGFPKPNCYDQRVWVGIGKKEVERISIEEAKNRLNIKFINYIGQIDSIKNYEEEEFDDLPF